MSIQQEIILRYRSKDHVRFQIPKKLCHAAIASHLEQELTTITGVYSAKVYQKQGKISIHFIPELCNFQALAKHLFNLIGELEKQGRLETKELEKASLTDTLKQKIQASRPTRWAKKKYSNTKETVKAVSLLSKLAAKGKSGILKDPEKAMINFFNDIMVLYLIKTHWHIITQHWILRPLRYRYEWLTVFYLMYLLIRSRLPEKK